MKRLNPETGVPFKKGDKGKNGLRFWSYNKSKTYKKTKFYWEHWRNEQSYLACREKAKISRLKHQKEKPHMACATANKRYAAKLKRTPQWLTKDHWKQINNFYLEAADRQKVTGIKYEVDHIEPLQGENVSGLHVPWNLQILTKSENCKKGNHRG
jgi:hypothetical protein